MTQFSEGASETSSGWVFLDSALEITISTSFRELYRVQGRKMKVKRKLIIQNSHSQ